MPTAPFTLPANQWTDLGSTPCAIELLGEAAATYVIDQAAPASTDFVGHLLVRRLGEGLANVEFFGRRVFARGLSGPAQVVVSR